MIKNDLVSIAFWAILLAFGWFLLFCVFGCTTVKIDKNITINVERVKVDATIELIMPDQ
jgi:hypothetical protein